MKITYACGHVMEPPTNVYYLLKSMRSAEKHRFIENLEQNEVCPNCYRREQLSRLREQWPDLPDLDGSPRQINYAESIRARILIGRDRAEVLERYFCYTDKMNVSMRRVVDLFFDHLLASGDAKLWLDCLADKCSVIPQPLKDCLSRIKRKAPVEPDFMTRDEVKKKVYEFVATLDDDQLAIVMGIKKGRVDRPAKGEMADIIEKIEDDTTLRPEHPVSTVVTEITTPGDGIVCARSEEKLQKMIDIVKGLCYRWNTEKYRWQLTITETNGPRRNRVIELCRALLDAGLVVRVPDLALLDAIEKAEYEPVHPRWVIASDDGRLRLVWERGQDFAAVVRGIPRVRVFTNSANVPAAQYQSVLDFAGEYGFKIAPSAQAVIDKAVAAEKAQTAVEMKADTPTPEPLPKASTEIAEKDAGDVEIDPALRDGE